MLLSSNPFDFLLLVGDTNGKPLRFALVCFSRTSWHWYASEWWWTNLQNYIIVGFALTVFQTCYLATDPFFLGWFGQMCSLDMHESSASINHLKHLQKMNTKQCTEWVKHPRFLSFINFLTATLTCFSLGALDKLLLLKADRNQEFPLKRRSPAGTKSSSQVMPLGALATISFANFLG